MGEVAARPEGVGLQASHLIYYFDTTTALSTYGICYTIF